MQAKYSQGRLLNSNAKLLVVVALLLGALTTVRQVIASWDMPLSLRRDFIQEYLLARAFLEGGNPYVPVQQLAEVYFQLTDFRTFPHPTPHPPGLLPFVAVLGVSTYEVAQVGWLCLQLSLLLVLSSQYRRTFGWTYWQTAVFALALSALYPGYQDLVQGQFGIVLGSLLGFAVLAQHTGRPAGSGAALGTAIALKFAAIAVLPLLVLQRKWRCLAAAVSVVAISYSIVLGLLGPTPVVHYFREVLPTVAPAYRHDVYNLSLYTLGFKLLEGATTGIQHPITFPPLVFLSASKLPIAAVSGLVVMVLGIMTVLRVRNMHAVDAWLLLIFFQIIFGPLTWAHVLVIPMLLLPLFAFRVGESFFSVRWILPFMLVGSGEQLMVVSQKLLPFSILPLVATIPTLTALVVAYRFTQKLEKMRPLEAIVRQ